MHDIHIFDVLYIIFAQEAYNSGSRMIFKNVTNVRLNYFFKKALLLH